MTRIPREFSVEKAVELQKKLSRMILRSRPPGKVKFVSGLDSAYKGEKAFAAAVTVDCRTMETQEITTARSIIRFPYVPGLLAFREAPALITAARKLEKKPDVYLVDGHGFAHPRRFGLACHVGLALDTPTIGVAKSRLCGVLFKSKLKDKNETIGAVFSRGPRKPLYVSVGHKISLRESLRIVSRCFCTTTRDPITLAHMEANKMRKEYA